MTHEETRRPRVRFLLGGARSGKSRLAVRLARGDADVLFLATARPTDDDMEARVARHRRERPNGWTTVEAPLRLPETVREAVEPRHTVILDCLTLWVSNLLAEDAGRDAGPAAEGPSTEETRTEGPAADGPSTEERILGRADELLAAIADHGRRWIVVSNEVGAGVHPHTDLGRRYRDLLGLVNQRVAGAADRAQLVVAGRLIELEPPPG